MLTAANSSPEGSGYWIMWNGRSIEHYDKLSQLEQKRQELTDACLHLKSLGITPTTNSVVWHWSWFADLKPDNAYLPLLKLMPGFYLHGRTEEDNRKAKESCCPQYPVVESDGSVLIEYGNKLVRCSNGYCTVTPYDSDTDFGYHIAARMHYHPAQMGQPYHCGPCYAETTGVLAWMEKYIPLCDVRTILEALEAK